jgi:hypothetical protein
MASVRKRLAAILAAFGTTIGLRTTESDVTLTVEGRWSGKFDPVRLGTTILVVIALIVVAIVLALNLGDGKEVRAPPGPTTPTPSSGRLEGVEGGEINPYQVPESVPPGQLHPRRQHHRSSTTLQKIDRLSQGLLGTCTAAWDTAPPDLVTVSTGL